jgi:23S rRNA pseudouridine955/2504/2580 synthase
MNDSRTVVEVALGKDDEGRRLDRVLRIALPDLPLSVIFKALRVKHILVNGKAAKPDYRCKSGDRITFKNLGSPSIAVPTAPVQKISLPPHEDDSLDHLVLVRTQDIIFLNKPLGVLVHGGVNGLEEQVRTYLVPSLSSSLAFVPGPLHRLDRNTSGVIAFSCSYFGAREFTAALRQHKVVKWYVAILDGVLEGRQRWENMLFRDERNKKTQVTPLRETNRQVASPSTAKTTAIPLFHHNGRTLALFQLQTGKTHQIRAQTAYHGFPLYGDVKYGAKRAPLPYYLHAIRIDLLFEALPSCPKTIVAPLPNYFVDALGKEFDLTQEVFQLELDKAFTMQEPYKSLD